MFNTKIAQRESGILLYGITPPKAANTEEKILEITGKTISRLAQLDIDGLVIYDLQDEATRNPEERPFPFFHTIDAFSYASKWLKDLDLCKVVYCSVGKLTEAELQHLISHTSKNNASVFVGVPSKEHQVHISLAKAYELWNQASPQIPLGAVAIPERHFQKKNEHIKIAGKMESGCSFFITQCVYNVDYVKLLIADLHNSFVLKNRPVPTLIFTLTPCGSLKTLKFLDWLGINVPDWLANDLAQSQDILAHSVEVCIKIAEEIIEICEAKMIPFGLNIESVSIRKAEIEASESLLNAVTKLLKDKGLRRNLAGSIKKEAV